MKTTLRKGKTIASKMCVKCGKVLPLNAFYPHKEWAAQSFHDAWCKDCATNHCKDIMKLKEYCFYNNRRYSDAQYAAAMKKALYTLTNNAEYLKSSDS